MEVTYNSSCGAAIKGVQMVYIATSLLNVRQYSEHIEALPFGI